MPVLHCYLSPAGLIESSQTYPPNQEQHITARELFDAGVAYGRMYARPYDSTPPPSDDTLAHCMDGKPYATRHPIDDYAERMDIYSPPGTVVIFDAEGGYLVEKRGAKKILRIGWQYRVARIEIGQSSSLVYLQCLPDRGFNTVLFARKQ